MCECLRGDEFDKMTTEAGTAGQGELKIDLKFIDANYISKQK